MKSSIYFEQIQKSFEFNDLLQILNYDESDIIFLGGSLVEGKINPLSVGMGNKLSDVDVFILSKNFSKYEDDQVDYSNDYVKVNFKRLYGISIDIEIHSYDIICKLINQIGNLELDTKNDIRTFNLFDIPNEYDFNSLMSFLHRLLNSIPIYNFDDYNIIKNSINVDKYCKLMTRQFVNFIDIRYEDILGNIDISEYKTAVHQAREILLNTIKAFLFYKKRTFDRDKWVPLLLKNISFKDDISNKVYNSFLILYFETSLYTDESYKLNAEDILNFSNYVISIISNSGGL